MFSSSVESDLLDAVAGFSLCENNFLLLLLLNRQEFPVKSLWGWNAEFVQFSSPFEISVQSQGLITAPAGRDLLCLLSSCIVGVLRGNHFKYRGEWETISSSNAASPQTNLSTRLESLPGIERERERAFAHFFKFKASQLPLTLLTVKWARLSHTTSSMSSRLLAHGKQGGKLVAAYQKCTARAQMPISRGLVPLQSRLRFHKRAFTQMTQI